jgi:hypothetical protein
MMMEGFRAGFSFPFFRVYESIVIDQKSIISQTFPLRSAYCETTQILRETYQKLTFA